MAKSVVTAPSSVEVADDPADAAERATQAAQGGEAAFRELFDLVQRERETSRAEKEALLSLIAGLEAKVEELRTPAAVASEQAAAAGKLPVAAPPAPPVGFTSFQSVPRGHWLKSPLGPPVDFIICGCSACSYTRLAHWYCVVCRGGPYDYRQRYPHFSKLWLATGGIWGVNHTCCSEPCRTAYLARIGVIVGVNDQEPPPARVADEPVRPVTALDSD